MRLNDRESRPMWLVEIVVSGAIVEIAFFVRPTTWYRPPLRIYIVQNAPCIPGVRCRLHVPRRHKRCLTTRQSYASFTVSLERDLKAILIRGAHRLHGYEALSVRVSP